MSPIGHKQSSKTGTIVPKLEMSATLYQRMTRVGEKVASRQVGDLPSATLYQRMTRVGGKQEFPRW